MGMNDSSELSENFKQRECVTSLHPPNPETDQIKRESLEKLQECKGLTCRVLRQTLGVFNHQFHQDEANDVTSPSNNRVTRVMNTKEAPESQQDCLGCKVIGAGTFFAISGWAAFQYHQIPPSKKMDRRFIAGMSMVAAGLGIARALS
mmetsp:Transcript_11914/g.15587  ORF Transcript_11914/g.15587 Transcript_11914/m.15587 type:complete len:148 (+) Transcript_11914:94-537(+)